MKIRQAAYRPLAVVVGLTALLLFQGCYIKWGDETVVGQKDTALPGASVERGCVVKIEHGEHSFPPDFVVLLHQPGDNRTTFTRHASASSTLEVGKCYEWKLGIRDPSINDIAKEGLKAASREIASDTVRTIIP